MIRRLLARLVARHHADGCSPETTARVDEAERHAAELNRRADVVTASLTERLRQNHFAESLGIAWGNRRGNG